MSQGQANGRGRPPKSRFEDRYSRFSKPVPREKQRLIHDQARLTSPEDPGKVYRYINDTKDRISRMHNAGWVVTTNHDEKGAGVGTTTYHYGGVESDGSQYNTVLMEMDAETYHERKRREWKKRKRQEFEMVSRPAKPAGIKESDMREAVGRISYAGN